MTKLKILVAEDDAINRKLFSYILKDISRDLLMASNGVEAINIYKEHKDIDLILMDIRMPEMDGYEATHRIRQMNKDIKILALSAFSLSSEGGKAVRNGFDDYVAKPVFKDVLMKTIAKYFEI
ncbi:response regulator [Prolixibacteraceae bacterium Z1-6]|uniref:Response regulator n=1 Tax=Draconibacterium aestuarii TaxID=2998507 RepID=A0A9X3FCE3_9BACT|nr:response regulator [Prolixibacteraceae bacterium Z1-6]